MKMTILEKTKNDMRIELDQADMTLLHPLVEELLKDKSVKIAEYKIGHPELDKPVLHVITIKGTPETALKRAAKALSDTYINLRNGFEKEL